VLHHPLHDAVVGICTLVIALQPLPSFIACYAQGDAVLRAQLLQLGHYASGYDGRRFGVEEVHERLVELELSVDGVGEEIGIYEDGVRRAEGGVGLEEERRRDLWAKRC
jgi:hypothetical protein